MWTLSESVRLSARAATMRPAMIEAFDACTASKPIIRLTLPTIAAVPPKLNAPSRIMQILRWEPVLGHGDGLRHHRVAAWLPQHRACRAHQSSAEDNSPAAEAGRTGEAAQIGA